MPGSTPRSGIDLRAPQTAREVENARIAERLAEAERIKGRSLWQDAGRRFIRNRAATGALVVLALVVLFTLVGPFFAQWSNEEIDWARMGDIAVQGQPSLETGHYFGLDPIGRDLYARTIQATRTSLIVGVIGAFVAVVIGTLYGATSGFVGGWIDNVMMRTVDILVSIPYMFIIILLMVMFERSFLMLFVGIGIISWLDMSRIVRGQTLSLRHREFVEAAHAAGVGWFKMVLRHIVPNLLGVVVVFATLLVPQMILLESFISFLGLGVQEPNTSLGRLISEGASTITYGTIWQLAFPLFFFLVVIISLFFVGDGLRDALDPKDR
ncbi:ABC transporter permease subunit [Roseitranquillus sediminis]|uniref:ABC transporter permease subunit n=1 Tax=Roseitranquillus sediminis TaxID=2809051 RepID=UPI001D0CDB0E|nr:ABC transporter permease subunit [Roseitranquillus sediminis]MBM9593653.1 ABC transporter permease subunit [Roseitranquillus sediminis]